MTKTPNKKSPTKKEKGVKFKYVGKNKTPVYGYGAEFNPTGNIEAERLIEKARNNPDFKEQK